VDSATVRAGGDTVASKARPKHLTNTDARHGLPGGTRAELELLDERRFGNGTVYVRHRIPN
jgi:hypothetical protein